MVSDVRRDDQGRDAAEVEYKDQASETRETDGRAKKKMRPE